MTSARRWHECLWPRVLGLGAQLPMNPEEWIVMLWRARAVRWPVVTRNRADTHTRRAHHMIL